MFPFFSPRSPHVPLFSRRLHAGVRLPSDGAVAADVRRRGAGAGRKNDSSEDAESVSGVGLLCGPRRRDQSDTLQGAGHQRTSRSPSRFAAAARTACFWIWRRLLAAGSSTTTPNISPCTMCRRTLFRAALPPLICAAALGLLVTQAGVFAFLDPLYFIGQDRLPAGTGRRGPTKRNGLERTPRLRGDGCNKNPAAHSKQSSRSNAGGSGGNAALAMVD